MRSLKSRTAFVVLALLGSPALVYASVWALGGLGFDAAGFSLAVYIALIVGLPAVYIVGLGKAMTRPTAEIAVVVAAAVVTTFLLAVVLVSYSLSQADLN